MSLKIQKTPHKAIGLESLANVNDQLCFYLFADTEIAPLILAASSTHPDAYTRQAFPKNTYSDRIHVKTADLSKFQDIQLNQTLGMTFSFGTEKLLLYVKNVLVFWGTTNDIPIEIEDALEDSVPIFAKSTGADIPDKSLIKTLKYLRLRRNAFIHSGNELTKEFTRFLNYDAKSLDNYWSTRSTIPGLKFSNAKVLTFTPQECITLIKLIRVCIEEIDRIVVSGIDAKKIVRLLDSETLARNPVLRSASTKVMERRVRKIRKSGNDIYGLEATSDEINKIITTKI